MPQTKEATATIRGFLFQFESSVLQILEKDNAQITLEGVDEDIEIASGELKTLIQCKSYKVWGNTNLAEAIKPMYRHFLSNKKGKAEYKLHLQVLSQNTAKDIQTDTKKLKEILEMSTSENFEQSDLSNKNLLDFQKLFSIEESNLNEKEVISNSLAKLIGIKSGHILYDNVIGKILQKSTNSNQNERVITKKEFLEALGNDMQILATEWFLARKGEDKYNKEAKEIFKNRVYSNVIIYIETSSPDYKLAIDLIEKLKKYIEKECYAFPIIIFDMDNQEFLHQAKEYWFDNNESFFDEYPFDGCSKPKFRKIMASDKILNKFPRFIKKESLDSLIKEFGDNRDFQIINFYQNSTYENNQIKEKTRIPVNTFQQILNIIK